MNRVWDYSGFAISFTGLGYIAMWPLGAVDEVTLPPALRIVGVAAAVFVGARLLTLGLSRLHGAAPQPDGSTSEAPAPYENAALARPLRPMRNRPAQPPDPVTPRSQFGLRGLPR